MKTAAAAQRRQQSSRIAAREEKPRFFRRLFKSLKQGVSRRLGQQGGVFEQDDLSATQTRMFVQFFTDLTHGINTQRALALLRLKGVVVRMCARLHQLAAAALTTAFVPFRLLAHQKTGEGIN